MMFNLKFEIMFQLFVEGGVVTMSLLTLVLIAVLFAAWKAPRWVLGLGVMSIPIAIIGSLAGMQQGFRVIVETGGDVSPSLVYGGFAAMTIPYIYSAAIVLVALAIWLMQRPRV